MGLFSWLVIRTASAFGLLPHQRVRRYKVTLFGEALGTFTLPIGDHMEKPDAFIRPVLTPPFRIEFGEDSYYYWAEPDPDGGHKTVEFHPPTPELREEAARFYNTANGLIAPGRPDPARQQPLPTRSLEEVQLIRAILDHRDTDRPYLDYAAWLSAKGDPYGDFIRLTLGIAALPEGDERRGRLEERVGKIVAKYGPRWALPLAKIGIYPGVYIGGYDGYFPTIFHGPKGVIEELDLDHDALVFPANAPRLFHAAPFLRKLKVAHGDLTVGEFAAIPQFTQLESLSLSVAGGTAEDVRRFAESPHLSGLREFGLPGCQIGSEGTEHLARAEWLIGVRSLDLGSNALGDDGVAALAGTPNIANLTTLDLRYNGLTDRGLIALCRSPHLARLEVLNLESNEFSAESVRTLVTAPFAQTLTSLNLSSTQLGADALTVLATGAFPALTALEISYCTTSDEGVRAVVTAPFFRAIEVFRANSSGAGDATATALAAHGFVQLRELELANNAISDAGVEVVARSKAVTKLTTLKLNDNPFRAAGTSAVAAADMPLLEHLDLCRVACGPEGARALAAAPHFKSLKQLWISEENVGVAGREALLRRFKDDVVTFMS